MAFGATPSGIVNAVGLVFDIAGMLMLLRYGLPEGFSIDMVKTSFGTRAADEQQRIVSLSRKGVGLILIGFAVQLASNFIQ